MSIDVVHGIDGPVSVNSRGVEYAPSQAFALTAQDSHYSVRSNNPPRVDRGRKAGNPGPVGREMLFPSPARLRCLKL